MAIIYTYPVKSTLAGADLILISDSADGNKTKQIAASTLPGFSGSGIVSINGDTTAAQVIGVESGNTFLTVTDSTNTHNIGMTGALPIANGGTALTALGTREQILRVNSGATALEYADLKVSEVVHNNSGATITAGTPIRITGDVTITGVNYLTVNVASAISSTMPASGLAAADIADGAQGTMITSGMLENVRTNDITGVSAAGDIVYVSTVAGANTIKYLTCVKPNGTALIQNVGIVTRVGAAGAGSIQVLMSGRSNDLPNLGTPGAIWQGDTNGVPSNLALGTNGHVLTADTSTERAKWSALPASVDSISFGTTGLTASSPTGAVTVTGTLVAANGGTGQNSYTVGQLLYASGTTTLSPLGIGSAGQTLVVNGAGNAPEWSSAAGTGTVTSVAASGGTTGLTFSGSPITTSGTLTIGGTLGIANGGTGLTAVGSRRGYVLKTRGSIVEWASRDGFPATLTSAAAVTWNYANNSSAYFLLGSGNADVLSISNIEDGDEGVLILDGSASTTFQLPHNGSTILSKIASGGGYTPSANIDVLRFIARKPSSVTTFYWTITANMQNYTP